MQERAVCKCNSLMPFFLCGCLSGPGQHRTVAVSTSSCALSLPFTLYFHIHCLLFYYLGSNTSLLVVVMCPPEFHITKNFCFASIQLWSDLWTKIGKMLGFLIPDLGTHSSITGKQLLSRFYLLQIKIQTCHWYTAENDEIAKPKMRKGHKFLLVLGQEIHSHWNTSLRKERFQLYYYSNSRLETWTNQCEEKVFMNHWWW